MNLKQVKTKVLQLINQYSINGNLVLDSTNYDYTLRINNLIDTAQKELAMIIPIVQTSEITLTPNINATDWNNVPLPDRTIEIKNMYVENYPSYLKIDATNIIGGNILLDPTLTGTLILEYSKFPSDILDTSTDDTALELRTDVQELIPYYVAGHIYQEDNPSIATLLLNEYENKKLSLKQTKSYFKIENIFDGLM
ncbi:MAG: hypothetical protein Q8936_23920 [Bacillota bacterium]|nr:hypothetical protein [Bacillota bacterium]